MTTQNFNQMLARVYAAFGRTAPAENNAISQFLFNRVSFIEDRFCDPIAVALEGYEKMPANIGLAILSIYNSIAPVKEQQKKQCSRCYNNTGFVWYVNKDYSAPSGYSCKCPVCNGGNDNDLKLQQAKGSVEVPNDKIATDFWEELFGDFSDKVAKDKAQRETDENTDGKGKVADHFKPIAQAVDNLNDALKDFWAEA